MADILFETRGALGLDGIAKVGAVSVSCSPAQPVLLAYDSKTNLGVVLNYGTQATTAEITMPDGKKKSVKLAPYDQHLFRPR